MAYDDTGRVITATTPRPAGDSTGGDAVARVVYDTPLSGDGLPDLTTTAATGWLGTVDAPVMRGRWRCSIPDSTPAGIPTRRRGAAPPSAATTPRAVMS